MEKLSENLIEHCIRRRWIIIPDEKKKEAYHKGYSYVLYTWLMRLCLLIGILLIAIPCRVIFVSILFFIGFIAIRSAAGGYHAKTWWTCLVLLVLMYGIAVLLILLVPEEAQRWISLCSAALSLTMVFALAPKIHENDIRNKEEQDYLKRKSRIMAILLTTLIFVGTILFQINSKWAFALALGMQFASIALAIAKGKGRKEKEIDE